MKCAACNNRINYINVNGIVILTFYKRKTDYYTENMKSRRLIIGLTVVAVLSVLCFKSNGSAHTERKEDTHMTNND